MEVIIPLLLGLAAMIGTAFGGLLTYRVSQSKLKQDSHVQEFLSFQGEVSRLREDLKDKDASERVHHQELSTIRKEQHELSLKVLRHGASDVQYGAFYS